jgi:hypothetical protein
VNRVREQRRIAVDDAAVDDAVFEVTDRVSDRDLAVAGEHGRKRLVGRGELNNCEVRPMLGEPRQRLPDPALDPLNRILDALDRMLLSLPQVVVRRLQELREQLLLGGEVPIEDALADAQCRHDVGHGCRVIAALGEKPGRHAHQLLSPFASSGRELAPHPAKRSRALDRPVNNQTSRRLLVR